VKFHYHEDMDDVVDPDTLAPTLLISMPQLLDPNFKKSVVLLCDHTREGAFGLVINRPTDTLVSQVVRLDPPLRRDNGLKLWLGGPVELERGWILLNDPPDEPGCLQVSDTLFVSTSMDLLRRLVESDAPPSRARLLTGYAGWGPGQLDTELAESAWLTLDVDPDLVFDTPPAMLWEAAIRRLGAAPSALQTSHGVH